MLVLVLIKRPETNGEVSSDPNPGAFAAVMSGAGDAGAWEAALALLRHVGY